MREFELHQPLRHVAFIMDGNGRWAKARHLPRHLGHKEACERIVEIFDSCRDYGIRVASFYAFSTENWKRPAAEIAHLFRYLELFFKREIAHLEANGTRIIISGDLSRLPLKTQATCQEAMRRTKDNDAFIMNICLNYGGRAELTRAVKLIATEVKEGRLDPETIDEKVVNDHLYTHELPDVDLLIRTSGEKRISNFLPWQICYAEFVFPNIHWPDFKREAFVDCLKEYDGRKRRYGGLRNDVSKKA